MYFVNHTPLTWSSPYVSALILGIYNWLKYTTHLYDALQLLSPQWLSTPECNDWFIVIGLVWLIQVTGTGSFSKDDSARMIDPWLLDQGDSIRMTGSCRLCQRYWNRLIGSEYSVHVIESGWLSHSDWNRVTGSVWLDPRNWVRVISLE